MVDEDRDPADQNAARSQVDEPGIKSVLLCTFSEMTTHHQKTVNAPFDKHMNERNMNAV